MNNWQMNRAGLLNFWYYDEEIFSFSEGKLLLRGTNGSGKSVTMQSLLPVLLDGRTSPDRLDPFGSKARRMEDYLLGEKDIVNRDERTGYLFLEFKRKETDQYLTIGIGLQAKRHKQMKFWGFVITENSRIGYDMKLYKLEKNAGEEQKIPLSRIELENLIGDGGYVVQTKTEYMKLVNKYLFGFETIEAYEDLIKLLIQLRSPKLSKDFKPTVIFEILEAALPPLSDEDLRHLSDTIEHMDQTKQQIEQLDREADAINRLNQVYHTYNQLMLVEQANDYLRSNKRLTKEQDEYQSLVDKHRQLIDEIQLLNEEISDLNTLRKNNQKQEERLKSHKVWNLESERRTEEQKLKQEMDLLNRKNSQQQDRKAKENQLRNESNQLEEQIAQRQAEIKDKLLDLRNDAEEFSFASQHLLNEQDFMRNQQTSFDFSLWMKEVNKHLTVLEKVVEDLRNFEQLKEKYVDKNAQLGEEQKLFDESSYQEQEWTRLFEEDKDKKLNEIHTWIGDVPWLHIQDKVLQATSRAIHHLYEPASFEDVKQPFRQASFQYEQEQREKLSQLNFELQQLEDQQSDKQKELQLWKAKKDPEPPMDPLTKEARQQLDANGVAYTPFYAAVEFHNHVEVDVRKRIEAALMESGMMDALITGELIEIQHDRILRPTPNTLAYTLADYLKPDLDETSQVSASLVEEVLQSILIGDEDEASFSIDEQGYYRIGLMKGHALPVKDVRYIGRTARRRFREEQIQNIQAEIEVLEKQKQSIQDEILKVRERIQQAKMALERFPSDTDLQESFRQIKEVRLEMGHHSNQIQKLSDELKEIHGKYTEIKYQIDEQTREYNLGINLASYQDAIHVAKRYEKDLFALEKEHIQYVNNVERLTNLRGRLEELEQELLEIQGEINISSGIVKELQQNIKLIEQQLEEQGVRDIRKQIEDVQAALQEIEISLAEKTEKRTRKESDRDHVKPEIDKKKEYVAFWTKMKKAWEDSFENELNRGFIELNTEEEWDLGAIASYVIKDLAAEIKGKDRDKLSTQLTQEFYRQQSDLMEYRPNNFSAPVNLPGWIDAVDSDEQLPHVEKWKQKLKRQIIELDFHGKQVSPYTVQKEVELEHARQESFLDEQDRALYEEILFNSVGQKLRARIRRAEQWVLKMKHLMESRDTSSGLTFSIKWKPKTADSDAELDTVDLVHLLRQDPKLLKEEDLEKITIHFRSKIATAKEMIGESSELQTLLQVLKEVLDYRKWFSFVLYFKREGEQKRELNNNQFFKFSGGEKAMAMYIPLFTACYSRYSEADDDAPYIISLDEAFAGVDENNIREMFEIVEQLGFNYIMNSQVLWGDYDTIDALSICELVRPKNADFVSVIRYHWDGHKREFELPETTEDKTLV